MQHAHTLLTHTHTHVRTLTLTLTHTTQLLEAVGGGNGDVVEDVGDAVVVVGVEGVEGGELPFWR